MLIGAHVSVAGGLETGITRAEALGVEAVQTFASSPRSIHYSPLSPEAIGRYVTRRAASHIKTHVFHGVYLINLAHENPAYVAVCVDSLKFYQTLAGQIGGLGTVFHVGSHKGKGLAVYLTQIAHAIADVLAVTPPGVWLLLENAAGQNGTIGQSLSDLQRIMAAVRTLGADTERLGVAIDTQHAFASGYDLRTVNGLETLLTDLDMTVGLAKLQLVHLNDSLVPFNGQRDRHANIGEGEIGAEGIARVVNHPRLQHLPMILEVPGEKEGVRRIDVDRLKALRKQEVSV